MNFINKMRIFTTNYAKQFKYKLSIVSGKFEYLKINNLSQAVEFIEFGMVKESYHRLKIILTLWPNEEQAKYLLALVYILLRENKKASNLLKDIKNYKVNYSEKLLDIINKNKVEKIIETYKSTYNINEIENEIYKIAI